MPESKLSDIIATSLASIKALADANTIIGRLIVAGKTTIIPVSRVSVGFASGGVDYFGKNSKPQQQNGSANGKPPVVQNFGGGGGTGLTVTPICFLIIKEDDVELLPIAEQHSPGAAGIIEAVGSLLDRSPEIVSKLKKAFAKDKEEAEGPMSDPASSI